MRPQIFLMLRSIGLVTDKPSCPKISRDVSSEIATARVQNIKLRGNQFKGLCCRTASRPFRRSLSAAYPSERREAQTHLRGRAIQPNHNNVSGCSVCSKPANILLSNTFPIVIWRSQGDAKVIVVPLCQSFWIP